MILSLDTETTGTDFFHGCVPFLATACDGDQNYIWQGEVNPYNREVYWEKDQLTDLQQTINKADRVVMHNAQFDIRALSTIGITVPFEKIEETLIASHMVCSGDSHNLKDLAVKYLQYWDDDEEELEAAVKTARQSAARKGYEIARAGHKHFPGLKKGSWWKMDMWLAPEECRKYAFGDAERTWLLWKHFEPWLVHGGYWKAYEARKDLIPICYEATSEGLNLDVKSAIKYINYLKEEIKKTREYISQEMGAVVLFKWEKKEHMIALLHNYLKLPKRYTTEKGYASTNKMALAGYAEMTDHPCMKAVVKGIKLSTRLRYAEGYFDWLADDGCIHSNINITGTRETRQSSNNPNLQNVTSSLAKLFIPKEGFIWWYADFVNIELRLWAYATNNEELISAFSSGKSVHMMIMELLYPAEAAAFKRDKENEVLAKLYRDIKAGNFALIYGATEAKADETYRQQGATAKIFRRFPGIREYTQSKIKEVMKNTDDYCRPFLTTLLGYPLDVPLDEPFKSCNYYIQGSAGMIMGAAMRKIYKDPLYKQSKSKIVQQVHDSLRIQIPINKYLFKVIEMLERTMSNCVIEEFGPTPIDTKIEYNPRDKSLLQDLGLIPLETEL